MGLKSLTLQNIPWCSHVFGWTTCRPSPEPIRLFVGSDGQVQVYHKPVAVVELMKEYPRHFVCRSDTFFIGQKVPALAAGDHLQPGQCYFLLPSHFFHSVLSFVTLASSLTSLNRVKKGTIVRPFDVQKTADGTLQITVPDEFFLADKMKEEEETKEKGRRVCTTDALEKEYRRLVRSKSVKWRPNLETIREKNQEAAERRRGGPEGFGGWWWWRRRS